MLVNDVWSLVFTLFSHWKRALFQFVFLRLSVFQSVTALTPSNVLRQGSHLKDNHSPPLVLEPASLLAVTLTATRVQQFPQLRSSLEYFENLQF